MTTKQFKAYNWLLNLLNDCDGISLEEINNQWIKNKSISDGKPMNRRTFMRYRNEIEDLFGIEIGCEHHGDFEYYIKKKSSEYDDELHRWMLSTLMFKQRLADKVALYDRILTYDMPSGNFWLEVIIDAMKENKKVVVHYRKYDAPEAKEWLLSPYCLKMYGMRWFMLGMTEKGSLLTFALDRMENVDISDESFVMDSSFDAREYFNEMYGICRDYKSKKQRVVIRTFDDEHHYLRDLPLHHSQKEIGRGDGYVDFELKLHINKELSGYILSRGKRMKVLKPLSFAREIEEMRA